MGFLTEFLGQSELLSDRGVGREQQAKPTQNIGKKLSSHALGEVRRDFFYPPNCCCDNSAVADSSVKKAVARQSERKGPLSPLTAETKRQKTGILNIQQSKNLTDKTMKNLFRLAIVAAGALLMVGCNFGGGDDPEDVTLATDAVYITNEGNWGSANASLSVYNPETKEIENGIFRRVNAVPLGDVAQSAAVYGDDLYVVVNNSGVVFRVDRATMTVQDKIEGLTSPRFIALASDTKGYISDMYTNKITIFNPKTCEVMGDVTLPEDASSEQMVVLGDKLYVAWWSYGNTIFVIDTKTDKVVDSIEVGLQPCSLVADGAGKLWALSDGGGYPQNPAGYEAPRLMRINPATGSVERTFTFTEGDYFSSRLALNGAADTLYYTVGGEVWRMATADSQLPAEPFISEGVYYYSMAVDPVSSELYLGDAGDYVNPGRVMRYATNGTKVDEFNVGISPGYIVFGTSERE